jgi:hypothetical protein
MFRRYIQKLQQPQPCCPLCHRGFDLDADVRELVNEVRCCILNLRFKLFICVHHFIFYDIWVVLYRSSGLIKTLASELFELCKILCTESRFRKFKSSENGKSEVISLFTSLLKVLVVWHII